MQIHIRKLTIAALAFASAVSLAQTSTPVKPMAPDANLSFAAAAIKPHDPNDPCRGCAGFDTEGDRVTIRNKSVSSILQWAYAINPRQIVGAPDWVFNETFDIVGTTDTQGELTSPQFQSVLQNLLADRFGLKFHQDKRDLPVYAIKIAKSGPKFKPADPGEQPDSDDNSDGRVRTVTLTNASLDDFAARMKVFADRPLVDQTGLTGKYDFTLRYTIDDSRAADPSAPPGLFTAIQEQLGLKLVPTKAPVDVFVIDHVERPSPN